ncbi:cytochrome P450 [Streptomyces sviceus]|uniref:cytochrome P450 n=1 Tax=Streptomyces sviceus TaxID=285530 RepID=UPI0036F16E1F
MNAAAPPPIAPGAVPILGHIPHLARNPLAFFQQLQRYGPLTRIRLGSRAAYVVTQPDLVRRMLIHDHKSFDKGGPLYDKVRAVTGNGLITCPAHEHSRQRPLMQPAFHPARFPRYTEIMRDSVAEVCDTWRPGQTVPLTQELLRLTALVTSRTLVSAPQGAPAAAQVAESFPAIAQGLYWRMMIPGSVFPKIPFPVNRRFDRHFALTRAALDDVITHYRTTEADYGDLLSMVVAACEEEPDPQEAVYDQVVTILAAGMETTAATTVWMLRLLSRHPHVMAKVQAELDDVLEGRLPGHDDIPLLPYTQNVLTETLRLYPSGWLVSRVATADVHWEAGHIPAGADVFFSPYALHRVPEIFPDPEFFDPDRWSPERATTVQRQGFLGFGAGRRKCIGDDFGITGATIAVATILSRWRLHHKRTSSKPTPRIVLMPPPTPAVLEPRPVRRLSQLGGGPR